MQTGNEVAELVNKLRVVGGFNQAAFLQLVQETSDEVALQILARFTRTLEESIVAIDQGLRDDVSEKVWRACHKLAGTAELIGFKAFGDTSRKLNQDLQALAEIGHYHSEIGAYLTECKAILQSIRTSFPALNQYL